MESVTSELEDGELDEAAESHKTKRIRLNNNTESAHPTHSNHHTPLAIILTDQATLQSAAAGTPSTQTTLPTLIPQPNPQNPDNVTLSTRNSPVTVPREIGNLVDDLNLSPDPVVPTADDIPENDTLNTPYNTLTSNDTLITPRNPLSTARTHVILSSSSSSVTSPTTSPLKTNPKSAPQTVLPRTLL